MSRSGGRGRAVVAALALVGVGWITGIGPAGADALSPEHDLGVGLPARVARPAAEQASAAAVADEAGFLAVWDDRRFGTAWLSTARLDPAGGFLDPVALPLALRPENLEQTVRAQAAAGAGGRWVAFVGVDPSGPRLLLQQSAADGSSTEAPVVVRRGADVREFTIACRSTGCLVVWVEWEWSSWTELLLAARVDATGVLLDPGGVLVSSRQQPGRFGAYRGLAAAPLQDLQDGFLLAWGEPLPFDARCNWPEAEPPERLHLARLDEAGVVLDPGGVRLPSDSYAESSPTLAVNQGNVLLAWQDWTGGRLSIHAARVSSDLSVAGMEPAALGGGEAWAHGPRAVASGDGFVVAWSESAGSRQPSHAVRARRLDGDGAASEVEAAEVAGLAELLALAGTPGGAFAVGPAKERVRGEQPLRAAWWEPDSVQAPGPIDLSRSAPASRVLAVAAGEGEWIVATSNALAGLVVTRLDAAGAPQGPPVVATAGSPATADALFDGTRFLLVEGGGYPGVTGQEFSVPARIFRIAPGGTLLDPEGTSLPLPYVEFTSADCFNRFETPGEPRLGRAGGATFVTYSVHYGCYGEWGEYGRELDYFFTSWLDQDGLPIDYRPRGSPGARPVVAGDGDRALVLLTFSHGVVGELTDGTTSTPTGSIGLDTALDLAFGADRYLAVGTLDDELAVVVLSAEGLPMFPPVVLGTASAVRAREARAAWDGTDFVVAWTTDPPDVLARRVRPDGSFGPVVEVSRALYADEHPRVASSGDGTVVIAFDRADPTPPYGARRARVRMLGPTPAPVGWSCASESDCAGGRCVDAVCCDSDCGGGEPGDCQACSRAGGAAADGTCAIVPAGVPCRPAAGPCDIAELCDGAGGECPADGHRGDGALCGPDGSCSLPGTCRGNACVEGGAVECPQPGECRVVSCGDSGCAFTSAEDGTPCGTGSCTRGFCPRSLPVRPECGVELPDGYTGGGEPGGGSGAEHPVRVEPGDGGCGCGHVPESRGVEAFATWIGTALAVRLVRRRGSARAPSRRVRATMPADGEVAPPGRRAGRAPARSVRARRGAPASSSATRRSGPAAPASPGPAAPARPRSSRAPTGTPSATGGREG